MTSDMPTQPPSQPQEVTVTMLLEGGQQYTVTIPSQNALLQQLFETLVARNDNRPQRLFQVPIQEGKAVLCFPSDRLVGLVTEPPLVLQQQPQGTPNAVDSLAPGL